MGRVVLVLCALLVSVRAFASPSWVTSSPELEKQFRADIEKVSAEAAVAWDQANAARDADRLAEAEAAYRKAIALAPNVDHPHRRLCGVLGVANRVDEAVHECEVALSLAPASAYDKSALAKPLLVRGHAGDRERGATLSHEAAATLPNDVDIVAMDCLVRARPLETEDFSACVDHVLELAPDAGSVNYLAAQRALLRGDYHPAGSYLEKAKAAGLPKEAYDQLSAAISRQAKRDERVTISSDDVIGVGVPVFLGWCLLLVLLMMVGNVLSDATLRSAGHLTADAQPTPRERWIRRVYRFVLMITGAFFYISLPLLVVFVVAAALLTLDAFDHAGATPTIVIVGLVAIVGSTALSVLRALFFVPPPRIEGQRIDLAAYPALQAVLVETAEAIGTRPVDAVYLTPGTDASVTERRTLWRALLGAKTERILILGVGLFDGMKQRELRSVLAHEYGHFRNADVGHSLDVRRSLQTLLESITSSRYALFNPAWWMLRAFTRLYLVISLGASRLQEMLADRCAIRAYGSDAFVASHRHIVRRSVEFPADVGQTINDVIANKWTLPNVYAYDLERKAPDALEAKVRQEMEREATAHDSHPSPRQRIEWATKLALPAARTFADGDEPVWALFPDPETIERDMTALIRDRVNVKTGIRIGDAEWADEPS